MACQRIRPPKPQASSSRQQRSLETGQGPYEHRLGAHDQQWGHRGEQCRASARRPHGARQQQQGQRRARRAECACCGDEVETERPESRSQQHPQQVAVALNPFDRAAGIFGPGQSVAVQQTLRVAQGDEGVIGKERPHEARLPCGERQRGQRDDQGPAPGCPAPVRSCGRGHAGVGTAPQHSSGHPVAHPPRAVIFSYGALRILRHVRPAAIVAVPLTTPRHGQASGTSQAGSTNTTPTIASSPNTNAHKRSVRRVVTAERQREQSEDDAQRRALDRQHQRHDRLAFADCR